MPAQTVEQQLVIISKSVGDLAEVVRDMARHVYNHDESMYSEEEDYQVAGMPEGMEQNMGGGVPMAEDAGGIPGSMPGEMPDNMAQGMHMGEEEDPALMEDPMMEDPAVAQMGRPHSMSRGGRSLNRGYAGVAVATADEEDSPFDEQQDNLEGNEVSPAGEMGGDRADETFNANFSSPQYKAMMQKLNRLEGAMTASGILVKGVVPGVGLNKSRNQGPVMIRDVEEAAKSRSFRELNALREQAGDLPRMLF